MWIAGSVGALAGWLLGRRFTVFALVPLHLAGALAFIVALLAGARADRVLAAAVSASLAINAAYLLAALMAVAHPGRVATRRLGRARL